MSSPGAVQGRTSVIAATLSLLLFSSVSAQEKAPALHEPIIARMPARASWSITTQRAGDQPAAKDPADPGKASGLTVATITKDGTTYRIRYNPPLGGSAEVWSINGVVFALNQTGNGVGIVSSSSFPFTNFKDSDFEDFAWVNNSYFKGRQKIENHEVLVFEAETLKRPLPLLQQSIADDIKVSLRLRRKDAHSGGPNGDSPEAGSPPHQILHGLGLGETTVVWLDPASQKPLQLISGGYRLTVSYLPDAQPLTPPRLVLDRRNEEIQNLKSLEIKVSRPRP